VPMTRNVPVSGLGFGRLRTRSVQSAQASTQRSMALPVDGGHPGVQRRTSAEPPTTKGCSVIQTDRRSSSARNQPSWGGAASTPSTTGAYPVAGKRPPNAHPGPGGDTHGTHAVPWRRPTRNPPRRPRPR
jgi:hypothetical protein